MNPIFRTRHFLPFLLACAACGGDASVDISTITNETAHQAATEVAQESQAIAAIDSLPQVVVDSIQALQTQRQNAIQQALKDSKFAALSDRAVDSVRQAWLSAYSRSCDAADYERIMDALRTDEVLKQWSGQHLDSAIAYHGRLVAAKKACAAGSH